MTDKTAGRLAKAFRLGRQLSALDKWIEQEMAKVEALLAEERRQEGMLGRHEKLKPSERD